MDGLTYTSLPIVVTTATTSEPFCTSDRNRSSDRRTSASARSFSAVVTPAVYNAKPIASAANRPSPCTSGEPTNVGAMPRAIASWPSAMPTVLQIIDGVAERAPECLIASVAMYVYPIASVGPQPVA